MPTKILVTGATGQVGWELCRSLAPLGEIIAVSSNTPMGGVPTNLATRGTATALLAQFQPDLVVNAAAYTAVDKAEQEPDLAQRINSDAPAEIAAWAVEQGAQVIHYSTDYVFDGTKEEPYVESDDPNPVSVYGRTKLAGDEAILSSSANATVLRVSWVYGMRGNNFLLTMRRLQRERDQLSVVNDQLGAPTWSRAIAEVSALVAMRMLAGDERAAGLFHLSPGGKTTWFRFAAAIKQLDSAACELRPIRTDDYPTAARRPANSRLNSDKLSDSLDLQLPHWEGLLRLCLDTTDAI